MTRTLHLLRHAKSSWDDPALPDVERPLAPRGRRAATALRQHLRDRGIVVDRVLCSPAARARETWERVRAGVGGEPDLSVESRIYEADAATLLAVVRAAPGTARALMLVGHNPGFEELARALAGDGEPAALRLLEEGLATGALATFEVQGDWADVTPGRARLVEFVRPRDLG